MGDYENLAVKNVSSRFYFLIPKDSNPYHFFSRRCTFQIQSYSIPTSPRTILLSEHMNQMPQLPSNDKYII